MEMVRVCDKCKTSVCWQGILMCNEALVAGTIDLPLDELLAMKKEHPSNLIHFAFDKD